MSSSIMKSYGNGGEAGMLIPLSGLSRCTGRKTSLKQVKRVTFADDVEQHERKKQKLSSKSVFRSKRKQVRSVGDETTAVPLYASLREVVALSESMSSGVVSDSDDEIPKVRRRKQNIGYTRRRYMRKVVEFDDLEDCSFSLRHENHILLKENFFLESLLEKANEIVCEVESEPPKALRLSANTTTGRTEGFQAPLDNLAYESQVDILVETAAPISSATGSDVVYLPQPQESMWDLAGDRAVQEGLFNILIQRVFPTHAQGSLKGSGRAI